MTEKFGSGRFCSRSCANGRTHTEEQKERVSKSLQTSVKKRNCVQQKKDQILNNYMQNPNFCIICGKQLDYKSRLRKTCGSEDCLHTLQVEYGKKSAVNQSHLRRSKNEIYFYELCEQYFKNVEHNKPLFNGWDADVIIHDIKYAVLWNGVWHYKKLHKSILLNRFKIETE